MIDLYYFLTAFYYALQGNIFVVLLIIAICSDLFFAVLRAAKEKKINSGIGIDGIIRKVSMLSAVLVTTLIDMLVDINLICFMSEEALQLLSNFGIVKVALTEFICLYQISFEFLSVLKNLEKCGFILPKGIQEAVDNWLKRNTAEIEKKE